VILVSLGTHEQPFERALEIIAPLAQEDSLVIQHGHTPPRTDVHASWIEFTTYDELVGLMSEAEAVVCHAGVGTIMSALGVGKCPIVVARRAQFGEHVDDHQLQIATTFAERGIIVACSSPASIVACLTKARECASAGYERQGDLAAAVASATSAAPARRGSGGIPDPGEQRT